MRAAHAARDRALWSVVVLAIVLLVACAAPVPAPAAPPPPVAAPAASPSEEQATWERTLAAARQEGVVAVTNSPGQLFRDWTAQFEKAYPGIRLEYTSQDSAQFAARAATERQGGQYLWDVYMGGPGTAHNVLKRDGLLDPLKPALIQPGVLDDSQWLGGFDDGFTDLERTYVYDYAIEVAPVVFVNRDFVSEAELNRVEDLTDPKWRGKMTSLDPRQPGPASVTGAHLVEVQGEDWWRQLLGQDLALANDRRQQLDWVARGRYPIGVGVSKSAITEIQQQGVGRNVIPLAFNTTLGARLSYTRTVALFNRAPHPNAAKVYLNWLLSREGQQLFAQHLDETSRRLDVEGPRDRFPDPTVQYPGSVNKEAYGEYERRMFEIAREVLR